MRPLRTPCAVALLAVVALLGLACGDRKATDPASRERPERGAAAGFDLLLITIDTLRADRLGCYGHEAAITPVIDGLAAEGIRFDQATASAPITLPSHASILTGLDPPDHGARHNGTFRLGPGPVTLAERLSAAGYTTAGFVAAFVLDARYGLDRGFEHYDDSVRPRGESGEAGTVMGGYNERPASDVTDAVLTWHRQRDRTAGQAERRFVWAHYFDPHAPYAAPPRLGGGAGLDPYDSEVAFVDKELGRLLDGLRSAGRLDRTLVVVTSDHGEGLGDHDEATHADLIYDSTMRVPLIFHAPSALPGGRVIADRLAGGIDLVPTLLPLLGLEPPQERLAGRDLFDGRASNESRAIYIETMAPLLDYGWAPLQGLRRLNDKFILAPSPEYFDLTADPDESANLYADAESTGGLQAELIERTAGWPDPLDLLSLENPMSPEELERLASLGYVQARPTGGEIGIKDPKTMMPLWQRMHEAGELSLAGRQDEAVAAIGEVLTRDPQSAKAWYTAVRIFDRIGDLPRAEAAMHRALELAPRAEGYVILARYALGRGDTAAFETALAQAERLDPRDGGIYIGRGHALAQAGRLEKALAQFEKAIAVDPARSGPYAEQQAVRIRAALAGQ